MIIIENLSVEEALNGRTAEDFYRAGQDGRSFIDVYDECYNEYLLKIVGAEEFEDLQKFNPLIAHDEGAVIASPNGFTISTGFPVFSEFLALLDMTKVLAE